MRPIVSIIIPCYNGAETLETALRSILRQTFQDWGVIFLDDCSEDNSVEIARSIADSRFKIVEGKENLGVSRRLNELVNDCRSEFIARMDVDDVMFPDRLAKQLQALADDPKVDIVGGGVVSIDRAMRITGWRCPPGTVTSPAQILAGEVLYHPTIMGRSSFFRQNPYPTEYKCEDFALWAKSAKFLRIRNLAEPLLFYREQGLFTYSKYIGRSSDTRRVLKNFGPDAIGIWRTRRLIARRLLKDFIYSAFYACGAWNHALRLVNRPIPASDRVRYEAVLADTIQS